MNEHFKKVLDSLVKNLSNESKGLLITLFQEKNELKKETLRDLTNHNYLTKFPDRPALIPSRFVLDIHCARLEGAGLVEVRHSGRTRYYKITEQGKLLLTYIQNNK